MPQYLIPSNLESFVLQFAKEEHHAHFIIKKLSEFFDSPEHLKKKSFSGCIVYTLNIDYGRHKHRALFELTTIDEKPIYVLRSVAWMHDYNAALTWHPLGPISRQNIPQEYHLAPEKAESLAVSSAYHEERMVYFKEQWHEPTAFQSQILTDTHFPQLLIGAPGSGKTFVLTALMQEQAWNVRKILYITGNPALASIQKKEWSALEKKGVLHQASAQVVFLTFTEFYNWYCQEITTDTLLHQEELLARLTKTLPKHSSNQVLAELMVNSWQLHQDVAENNSYDRSHYKHSGVNKSLYSEQDKECLYAVLTKVLQAMHEHHEFYPGVSKIGTIPAEYSFDLIVVDESQNRTPQDLLNITLFSKDQRIVFAGDSLQKGSNKLSPLPIMSNALHQQFHASLKTHQLPVSLRLMPASARLANNLVLLYTNLRQGRADSTAYSSIKSAQGNDLTAPAEEDFVHLVAQHRLSDLKKIGADAHAAAIVLSEEDKDKARQYLNSANVFTHAEAQGLEFSCVFCYLSQETLARFSRVSETMNQLGITAETELKEYLHNPSQKGIVDGEEFELLSHLLVGLTRSCGSNWIYYEPVEGQLQHKLHSFLSWFNRAIGLTPENKQVKQTISNQQEWLTVINRFISEGALVQARENLLSILKLQAHEADAYIALYAKGKLKESLAAFQAWRIEPPHALIIPARRPSAALRHVKELVPATAVSSPAPTATKATAVKSYSFSEKQIQWIEQLYKSIDSEKNVNTLISHKLAAPILFEYKLAATQNSLLVSLFLDEPLKETFLTHFKKLLTQKKAYLELMDAGYHSARNHNDYWLMLCLCALANQFSKFNTPTTIKQFNELRSLALGQLAPRCAEELDTTFLKLLCLPDFLDVQNLDALATPFKDEHGDTGYSFLFWFILNINAYPDFVQQPKIVTLVLENLDQRITMKCEHQGYTFLFALLQTCSGRTYVLQYFDLIKKQLNDKNLFGQITEGIHQGKSAFSYLCCSPEGSTLIMAHWDFFSPLLTEYPQALFAPITGNGPDKGATPFYYLCRHAIHGPSIITTHWAFFSVLIKKYPQALFTPITGNGANEGSSAFYLLCAPPQGQSLIMEHWDFFSALIAKYPHGLFAQLTTDGPLKGTSAFYLLCYSSKGSTIIMTHWDFFSPLITKYPQALFAPITGNGPDEGASPFYFLCRRTLEGPSLITTHWAFFSALITKYPQGLFAPIAGNGANAGSSAFYFLCLAPKGQFLIMKHWDFFSTLIAKYPHAIFAPITADGAHKGTSAFYLLCESIEGQSLIIKQWAFFRALLAKKPQALFVPVTDLASNKDADAFCCLCTTTTGQSLIVREWEFFKKLISIEQLEQYPDGEKIAAMINQNSCLTRTIKFFSALINQNHSLSRTIRFFSAEENNPVNEVATNQTTIPRRNAPS